MNSLTLLNQLACACLLCISATLVGCGSDDPLNRQAVSGMVSLKGEPLDTGSISFEPKGDGTTVGGGATITDGNFEIKQERGLPPGTYLVRVFSADEQGEKIEMPGESRKLAPDRIPPEWNAASEQTIEVKDGDQNHFELKIP
ncbi:carboxypeptidase-like regulatory domain-containing protein [Thalassoroseus pseudoceratinae]|uniref:carboxypeptidase-like regulatory domain-containing protein n=1 Tax=Thalassoroseus pseudoceratinae TaxID=2713176 RepID=UPI0014228878|nr:carboxypeptidase-like regulatory domain-containing protein [Thalassoroseus pseudoceratinae]